MVFIDDRVVGKTGRLMASYYDEDTRVFLPKEKSKFRSGKMSVNRSMELNFVGRPADEWIKVEDKPRFSGCGSIPERNPSNRNNQGSVTDFKPHRFSCKVGKLKLVFGTSNTRNLRVIIGTAVKCPPMVLLPGKDLRFMGSSWRLHGDGCVINHPLVSVPLEPSSPTSSSSSMDIDTENGQSNEVGGNETQAPSEQSSSESTDMSISSNNNQGSEQSSSIANDTQSSSSNSGNSSQSNSIHDSHENCDFSCPGKHALYCRNFRNGKICKHCKYFFS